MVDYQKLTKFDLLSMKKNGNIPKQLKILNKFIALELWFTMENYGTMEMTMVLWKKNYARPTMEKIMKPYRKLWNFDLLWKKLWYFSKL